MDSVGAGSWVWDLGLQKPEVASQDGDGWTCVTRAKVRRLKICGWTDLKMNIPVFCKRLSRLVSLPKKE